MTCGKFGAYEAGRLTAKEFAEHALTCAECAELAALDARLDRALSELREAAPSSGLWGRIEAALSEPGASAVEKSERRPAKFRSFADFFRLRPVFAVAGAAVLLVLIGGSGLLLKNALTPSGILARRALANVEIKEKHYSDAIADLEKLAGPKIEAMDAQLGSLYRDKLAVIDAQVERCRAALSSNPANAHIRQYLLAALRDKRETLTAALYGR
jgi:hypothetical protein